MPISDASEKRLNERKTFRKLILFEMIQAGLNRLKRIQGNGVCLDISEGGLKMSTNRAFNKGEVVKLFLPVAKVETSLPVFAEVVWANPSRDRFRAGLAFLK